MICEESCSDTSSSLYSASLARGIPSYKTTGQRHNRMLTLKGQERKHLRLQKDPSCCHFVVASTLLPSLPPASLTRGKHSSFLFVNYYHQRKCHVNEIISISTGISFLMQWKSQEISGSSMLFCVSVFSPFLLLRNSQ